MEEGSYEGIPERTERGGFLVLQDGIGLDPRYSQAIINHSPNGFNWGYEGSGPAQLALALLLEEVGRRLAVRFYQDFKRGVVARFQSGQGWRLSGAVIRTWVSLRLEEEKRS